MPPDPAAPIDALGARIATDAYDLATAIAPASFAVMIALFVLTLAARLIREAL